MQDSVRAFRGDKFIWEKRKLGAVKTQIVQVDEQHIDIELMQHAGNIIKEGGLVAFPTETVYGLGGDALSPESSKKIYAAKGRPSDNPLIIHICRMEDLDYIAEDIPEAAFKLAEAFWPGPLTMIFNKSKLVPYETTGGLDTVAVRMPHSPIARAFIEAAGGYVAAPSANLSGRPSPTLAKYVAEDMAGRVEMILDGGDVELGLESTIIDMTAKEPVILRPGYITKEMLAEFLSAVDEDETIMHDECGRPPKAPGMKYRHYAPNAELTVVDGDADCVIEYINKEICRLGKEGHKTGVIAADDTITKYRADICKNIGNRNDGKTIARELYRILREFDDEGATVIFSEAFDTAGVGRAVMNRLLKAAGHHIVHLQR